MAMQKVLKMLLAGGANKDAADNAGATPVYIAAHQGHAKVLEMLLAARAHKDAANINGARQSSRLPGMATHRS